MDFSSVLGSSGTMMMNGAVANGRIDLMSTMPKFDIPSYQLKSVANNNFKNEATYGQTLPNDLSNIFFSEKNIDALQQGIRYGVYTKSNGKYTIGRQSDQELKIIMRSIYLQYSRNTSQDCLGQVRELNAKVLDWAITEVMSNITQFDTYRQDASTMPVPLAHAPIMTQKGSKQLEQKQWL